jgi:pimeloyl-ACP methyl ester carboxylesterase
MRSIRHDIQEAERRVASVPRSMVDTPAGCTSTRQTEQARPCSQPRRWLKWIRGRPLAGRHVVGDDGFRFIAPSRFGYLGTPMPDGATAESQADAYEALLDHLAVDRVIVVGYSAGATSAIQCALRHPDRTVALISVSSNVPDRIWRRSSGSPSRCDGSLGRMSCGGSSGRTSRRSTSTSSVSRIAGSSAMGIERRWTTSSRGCSRSTTELQE